MELLNEIVFKRRKDLTLRVYGYSDTWADIDFLKYLPEVERFYWETDSFGSVEPLHHLNTLSALHLGFTNTTRKKLSLTFLSEYSKSLIDIGLTGDYKDINTLSALTHLKRAWFVSTPLANFDLVCGLSLEELGNYGSRVKSLESLGRIESLRWLWIKTNTILKDIDFVRNLTNLEKLDLLWLSNLVRLPDLSHLKRLKHIEVFQGKRFEDYSGAMKLKECHISVSGPKIRPHRFIRITTP
jgi:hypothetical protein